MDEIPHIWRDVDFGIGTVIFLDDVQKEDMLQVEYPNGVLLDMGWYQDRYIISVVRDFDWEHPVRQDETSDGYQLPERLIQAARSAEEASQSAQNGSEEVLL